MATKVNTKFVLVIGGVAAALLVGLAVVGTRVLNKSADAHMAEAAEMMKASKALREAGAQAKAAGNEAEAEQKEKDATKELEKAVGTFGKAVSKEPNEVKYLDAWIAAMEQTQPVTRLLYNERYTRNYLGALQKRADAQRTNIDAHRKLLDPFLYTARLSPSATQWNFLIETTVKMMNRVKLKSGDETAEEDKSATADPRLRRYRGIARVGLLKGNIELKEEDREFAKRDLEAALAADPKDEAVAIALIELAGFQARHLRKIGEEDRAIDLIGGVKIVGGLEQPPTVGEARKMAASFIERNPPAAGVRHAITVLEFFENMRVADLKQAIEAPRQAARPEAGNRDGKAGADEPARARNFREEVVTSTMPRASQTLDYFEQTDPKLLDPLLLTEAARFAVTLRVPEALPRSIALMETAAIARNTDPLLLFQMGQLADQAGEHLKAIEKLQLLAELPNRPLSFEGNILFALRDMALRNQTRAAIHGLDASKTKEEKQDWLKRIGDYRQKIEQRAAGDAELGRLKLLIDGRLEMDKNNFAMASKYLSEYSEQTGRNDVEALRLLTFALIQRRDSDGAARAQIKRLEELGAINRQTFELLAEMEGRMGNRQAAIAALQQGMRLEGDQAARAGMQARIDGILELDEPKTAVGKELKSIQKAFEQPDVDMEKLLGRIRELAKNPPEGATPRYQVGMLLMQFSRDDVTPYIARSRERFGDTDQIAAKLEGMIKAPQTVEAAVRMIEDGPDDQLTKAVQLVILAVQNAEGRGEEGQKFIEDKVTALEKLEKDHRLVISNRFETTLATQMKLAPDKRDFTAARALADRAVAENADNLKGNVFRAQIALAEGKLSEAVEFADKATKEDKNSALAWQMLGSLQLQTGRTTDGIASLAQSNTIKPNQVQTVMQLAQAYVGTAQPAEALRVARAAKAINSGNSLFVNFLLQLESSFGDASEAMQRREVIFNTNPRNAQNTGQYLFALLKAQDFAGLEKALVRLEAIPDVPKEQPARFRALLLAGKGDLEGGLAQFEVSVANVAEDKRDWRVYYEFAKVALDNGLPEISLSVADRGRKFQPADVSDLDRMIGDTEFARGTFDKAAAAYKRAMDVTPVDTNNVLALRLSDTLLRLGKFQEAEAILVKLKSGDDANKVNVMLLRSQAEQAQGRTDEARVTINEVLRLDPKSVFGLIRRAEIIIASTFTDKTAVALKAARESKDLAAIRAARAAKLTSDAAASKDAMADLETALRLNPRELGARRMLAGIVLRSGAPDAVDKAIATMREGITVDPDNEQLRMDFVQQLMAINRTDDAIIVAEEAISRPGNPRQWLAVAGDLHSRAGRHVQASEMYARLWEIEKNPMVAERFAVSLMARPTPDLLKAKEVLSDKAAVVERNPQLMLVRARAYMLENREAEWTREARAAWAATDTKSFGAVSAYFPQLLRQVFRKPGDARPRMADAERFIESLRPAGGFSEAVELALAVMRLSGDDATKARALASLKQLGDSGKDPAIRYQAYRTLGGERVNSKEFEPALAAYAGAESVNPGTFENLNDMAYVLGRHQQKWTEALPLSQKAAELAPENVFVLGTLGTIYLGLNRLDDAESVLLGALNVATTPVQRASPVVRLVELKLARDDKTGAREIYTELLRMIDVESTPKQIPAIFKEDLDKLAADPRLAK